LLLAYKRYMNLTRHNQRVFELAQTWPAGIITKMESNELNVWYQSMEDATLGSPTEHFVDGLELRLV
jgi:hypothetical protein